MPTLVRLNEISKRFPGGVQANNNISIKARGGEVHGILGENGAGKTTLMRILAGLYRPDSGCLEIDGSRRDFHSSKVRAELLPILYHREKQRQTVYGLPC